MTGASWLDDIPVLYNLPPETAAAKLREVGEDEAADDLEAAEGAAPVAYALPKFLLRKDRAWRHSSHAIGYLPTGPTPENGLVPIRHAGNMAPDHNLKDARIKLTLDGLRVADYPGSGEHLVLFDFAASNQIPGSGDSVHFNATYRATEGEQAAVIGRPIFLGLKVGAEGLFLQCATVNVQNEADEAFLKFLESDAFKSGLLLATTLQPVLLPFSAMAMSLTKAIAERHRNVGVQAVEIGLDFRATLTGARLAEGSYIVVQIPESLGTVFQWSDWAYDAVNGRMVRKQDSAQILPYNYFVVGVSRYEGP